MDTLYIALAATIVGSKRSSLFKDAFALIYSAGVREFPHYSFIENELACFAMDQEISASGSGELDNGLTVTTSFELDQGAGAGVKSNSDTGKPFDSHGLTVGSDAFGTLTFQGHGGAAAQSAVDDMATGDIWDNGMGHAAAPTSSSTDNMLAYSLPSLMDGVSVDVSYVPHTSTQYEDTMDVAVAYTGVEGLTIGYASGENKTTKGSEADVSTYYLTYAYGPITVAYANTEYDSEATATDADIDFSGYSVAYTVSDEISIAYKVADQSTPNKTTDSDQEVSGVTASYTAGGMTISGKMINGDNMAYSTAASADKSMWELSASFAF